MWSHRDSLDFSKQVLFPLEVKETGIALTLLTCRLSRHVISSIYSCHFFVIIKIVFDRNQNWILGYSSTSSKIKCHCCIAKWASTGIWGWLLIISINQMWSLLIVSMADLIVLFILMTAIFTHMLSCMSATLGSVQKFSFIKRGSEQVIHDEWEAEADNYLVLWMPAFCPYYSPTQSPTWRPAIAWHTAQVREISCAKIYSNWF